MKIKPRKWKKRRPKGSPGDPNAPRMITTATGGKLAPWRPGQSGNPGGRTHVPPEIKALAKGYTEAAITTLGDLMLNKKVSPGVRAYCANSLLNRAWGTPMQAIAVADLGKDSLLTASERSKRVLAILDRVQDRVDRGEGAEHDSIASETIEGTVEKE